MREKPSIPRSVSFQSGIYRKGKNQPSLSSVPFRAFRFLPGIVLNFSSIFPGVAIDVNTAGFLSGIDSLRLRSWHFVNSGLHMLSVLPRRLVGIVKIAKCILCVHRRTNGSVCGSILDRHSATNDPFLDVLLLPLVPENNHNGNMCRGNLSFWSGCS